MLLSRALGPHDPADAEPAGTPDDWGRLRALFDEAVALPPGERAAWVAGLDDLHEGLREELEQLLEGFDPGSSLEVEGLPRIAGVFAPGGPASGDRVGPYIIEASIGRGGMGQVFRATQDRTAREVALKILNHPFPSRRAMKRFEVETQALARLNHPNIAQVYEAGVVEAGGLFVPWYAMELVATGETLREWIDGSRPLAEGLEMFLQVCAGVAHAHQRGVLHRDLKPHNVVVDEQGCPKLIDFGIAKLLDQEPGHSVVTSPGQLVGTVAYMSPEQAEGKIADLDARSDQYALGVVLYELLCGQRPHVLAGLGVQAAVLEIICEPPTLEPLVRAGVSVDLRMIVAKALAREPDDRYTSVGALAEDIRRARDGDAILARPPNPAYLFQRFAARNPVLVGVALVALLALLVGALGLGVGLRRARRATAAAQLERDRAETLRERAERAERDALWARDFVTELLAASDPWRGTADSTTLRELLARAGGILDASEDPAPRTELHARLVLARVYLGLGEPESCLEQIDLAEQLIDDSAGSFDERRPELLRLRVEALVEVGQVSAAATLARESVALHRARFGDDDPRTWSAELGHAQALELGGDLEPARRLFERITRDCVDELGASHPDTLDAEAELGQVLFALGELDGAQREQRIVWQARRRELGAGHPTTLGALAELLGTLVEQGELEQAAGLFPELLGTLAEHSLGADSRIGTVAAAKYAIVLRRLDRADEALPLALRAEAAVLDRYGPDHADSLRQRNNVALILAELGRDDEAEEIWVDVVSRWQRQAPDAEGSDMVAVVNYVRLLERGDRKPEAAAILSEALTRERGDDEARWVVALAQRQLAQLEGRELPASAQRVRARGVDIRAIPSDL